MSFSSLLGQYATQKAQPQQEKLIRDPISYATLKNIESKIRSEPTAPKANECETNLCVLFIIIDDFPLEAIWRLWLDRGDNRNIEVYFHAKYPDRIRSSWVQQHLVQQFHYSPTWGSVDIAKVMLFMLKEASEKSPHINKFVFASESCLPIESFDSTITSIYGANGSDWSSSWVNWHDKSQCNGYSVGPQFEAMTASFPPQYIFKADQWCLLSRFHAEQILALRDAFDAEHQKLTNHSRGFTHMFTPGKATDELIIPCSLAILGHIKGKNTDKPSVSSSSNSEGRVLVRRSTYCDWSAREKRPRSFTPTSECLVPADHLKAARSEGCFFLRKIALPESTRGVSEAVLRKWLSIIDNDVSTLDERLQSALSKIEEYKVADAALEVKGVRHLTGVFNNYEKNSRDNSSNSSSSGDTRELRPEGGKGRQESNHRNHQNNNYNNDHKRKYEDRPRDQYDQRSFHRPYQGYHDYR